MLRPRPIVVLALLGAFLLPAALPAAADDDGDGAGDGWDDGRSGDDDHDDDGEGEGGRDGRPRHERGNGHDGARREGGDKDGDDDDDDDEDADEGDDEDGDDDGRDGKRRDGKHRHKHAGGDRAPMQPTQPSDAPSAPKGGADVRVTQDYESVPGLLSFTFTVENLGQAAARDVQLHGEVPDVGTWTIADPLRCTVSGRQVDCDLDDLAPGERRTVGLRSVVLGPVPEFTNVVQVYTPWDVPEGRPSSP